jgi:hypothetical protein
MPGGRETRGRPNPQVPHRRDAGSGLRVGQTELLAAEGIGVRERLTVLLHLTKATFHSEIWCRFKNLMDEVVARNASAAANRSPSMVLFSLATSALSWLAYVLNAAVYATAGSLDWWT